MDIFRFNTNIGKNWFANRVVNEANKLSGYVVGANTKDTLKRSDKFVDAEGR